MARHAPRNWRKTLDQVEPTAANRDQAMLRHARNLARLQGARRTLRARLRKLDAEIRLTKRQLRDTINDRPWNETGATSKIAGG